MPEVELEYQEEVPEDVSEEASETDEASGTEEEASSPSVEDIALEMGWKPKEDFAGHEEDYVDAATYIKRSKDIQDSMRQHLKDNKRKMSTLEQTISDIKNHYESVNRAQLKELKSKIEETKEQKREAIEEGDVERVEKYENQLSDLYDQVVGQLQQVKNKQNAESEPDPEEMEAFSAWTRQNPWYNQPGYTNGDSELTKYADYLAELPEYAGLPYSKKLDVVTRKVKETFPEKFKNGSPKRPPAVEGGSKTSQNKKVSVRDLTPEQRSVMNNFVNQGIMTQEQYINDLAEIGEI